MSAKSTLQRFVARYLGPSVVFVLFLTAWYALAYGLKNNFSPASNTPMIIPPPHRLFEDIHGIVRTKIFTALWISLKTTLVGLTLSICIGLVAGVLMAQAKWLERSIWPYLIALLQHTVWYSIDSKKHARSLYPAQIRANNTLDQTAIAGSEPSNF